jgi:hypothetical protein
MAARKSAKRRQTAKRQRARGRPGASGRAARRAKAPRRRTRTARRATATAPKGRKRAVKRVAAKRVRKTTRRRPVAPAPRTAAPPAASPRARRPTNPSLLDRERRRLPESERTDILPLAQDERLIAAARTGHDDLRKSLLEHTETSPRLTAGDVDAKWTDAYSAGDEAPGGDNPTPDQDRVDDIGRALGVQYQDDEELKPDEKIRERDRHRWELDPASSEDWPHKEEDEK